MAQMTPERLLSIALAIGYLAAPPIALLYGTTPGLFVLACALAITIALAASARSSVPEPVRSRLRFLLGLNIGLLVATLVALVAVNR